MFPPLDHLHTISRTGCCPGRSAGGKHVAADEWVKFMGDDRAWSPTVLYPTRGLSVGKSGGLRLGASAVCRAYNNWLSETYVASRLAFQGHGAATDAGARGRGRRARRARCTELGMSGTYAGAPPAFRVPLGAQDAIGPCTRWRIGWAAAWLSTAARTRVLAWTISMSMHLCMRWVTPMGQMVSFRQHDLQRCL